MKILVRGVVQGVGFRPTVHRVARSLGLRGYVLNKGSDVEIGIDGERAGDFIDHLLKKLPPLAYIREIEIKEEPVSGYNDFVIIESSDGERKSIIPADTAICEECVGELFDRNNRRYLYPFINCTSCGARFSLIEDMPYDRARTSMRSFEMCEECRREYEDPDDRRFHAETISCPRCGPKFTLYDKRGSIIDDESPIEIFAGMIDDGSIGIAKSWGGMHIICRIDSVERLRDLYGRPAKPFAVMFRNIGVVREYAVFDEHEEKLLLSAHRPIVLLRKLQNLEGVSPGLGNIGVYLPYSGFHHVLFHYLHADGVIMTSANIPGEPMIIRNEDAFLLKADCFLLHNREIVNRVDDSVVRCLDGRKFFLRKSRGFIPSSISVPYKSIVLSLGAGENVSFCISKHGDIYQSQYIGNSFFYPTMAFLEESVMKMLSLLGLDVKEIDVIGVDLHPGYPTRRYGKKLSEELDVELIEVQHHWAHSASLLVDAEMEEIVALTLDGTGYGTDGNIWGGEVLRSNFYTFDRIGSLENIPLIGGDKAIEDPRRVVFAIFSMLGKETPYFSGKEADILERSMKKSPVTSSFGRILDAVSCYLGICQKMTYDGEPAMKLERYLERGESVFEFDVEIERGDHSVIRTIPLFEQLAEYRQDIRSERDKADVAFSFVKALLDGMVEIAAEHAESHIGITGGVSYDVPIVRMVKEAVEKKGFIFLSHDRIPNGDQGISVGQNAIAGHLKK